MYSEASVVPSHVCRATLDLSRVRGQYALRFLLVPRLLKRVQLQGGARGEARGVPAPYVAAPHPSSMGTRRANAADGPFSAADSRPRALQHVSRFLDRHLPDGFHVGVRALVIAAVVAVSEQVPQGWGIAQAHTVQVHHGLSL